MVAPLELRHHGEQGPPVVVLHGGPGAPGSAWGLARGLGTDFRVLEPMQRRADAHPLTVARHVADLRTTIDTTLPGERPSIVGHSWGAMLALAFAAAHPERASALVLVGCGTFDPIARAELNRRIQARLTPATRARLAEVRAAHADADRALAEEAALFEPLFTWAPRSSDPDEPAVRTDARGHRESWDDMVRVQQEGVYPAAFAAIRCPVHMLHGRFDPHPGPMIRDSLLPWVPQVELVEIEACGHYPWRERLANRAFFDELAARLHARGA